MRHSSRSKASCRANSTARSIATAPTRNSTARRALVRRRRHAARLPLEMAASPIAIAGSARRSGRPSTTPAARCSALRRPQTAGRAGHRGQRRGVANTNIVLHGGRLLALEEGHLPFEMSRHAGDARQLQLRRPHRRPHHRASEDRSRHRRDDVLRLNAGAADQPPALVGSIECTGHRHETIFEAPFASMVHDFIVTENYAMFPILPLTGSMHAPCAAGRLTLGSRTRAAASG